MALICLLRRTRIGRLFLDFPKARGLHATPVPRIGGIAMFMSIGLLAGMWMPSNVMAGIGGLSLGLFAVSLLDDMRPLSALLRLMTHGVAALFLVFMWIQAFGPSPPTSGTTMGWVMSPLGAIVITLAIVWMTNLFNFMDGANGMAGGMAFIGFAGYAIAAAMIPGQGLVMATLAASVSGAALGFLYFNFPMPRVFMGDAGSVPLGFLAAALGIQGNLMGLWPWWFGALVFSPFIVDSTVTLLKRLLGQEKIWTAHREHYYQRLILSGWSHRKTVISYYFLMLASAISALFAQDNRLVYPIVTSWVITYISLLLWLEWHFHQHKKVQAKNNLGTK